MRIGIIYNSLPEISVVSKGFNEIMLKESPGGFSGEDPRNMYNNVEKLAHL